MPNIQKLHDLPNKTLAITEQSFATNGSPFPPHLAPNKRNILQEGARVNRRRKQERQMSHRFCTTLRQ